MTNGTQSVVKGKTKEINLKEYFDVLKKRFWLLVLITLLTTLAGYLHSIYSKAPPVYQTSTRFILDTNSEFMNTLIVLVKDPLVLDKVSEELGLNRSAAGLANQINVSNINESQVVRLSVIDSDPKMALAIAKTTAEVYKREIENLLGFTHMRIIPESKQGERIITIEQSNDRTMLMFVLGLIISIGVIFLMDSLDNSVGTERDVEELLGLPLIGNISKMNKKNTASKKINTFEQEIRGETVSVKQ